jgi:hypothetical protein
MKKIYRNCEIESKREKCLGGWNEVYWSAYNVDDGYEIACGFGGGTVRECFADMKLIVDEFHDVYNGNSDEYDKAYYD